MAYLIASALERTNIASLTQLLALTSLAIFLPFFIHLSWLTGPLVNAILILILLLSGRRNAIFVSCLPSLMALSGGLLPLVLAPAIPFIMISNIVFVLGIDWFYKRRGQDSSGYWSGVIAGSFLKFVFLSFSVNILATFFIKAPVLNIVVRMFGWSQLITALAGGLIAWFILRFFKFFR